MSAYAVSDIFGNYKVWTKIKESLLPNDEVFVLGNVIDYGVDGIKILQEIMNDERFHFILGYHEYLFTNRYYNNESILHNQFGGINTWNSFMRLPLSDRYEVLNFLKQAPLFETIMNENGETIYMSNNGCEDFTHKEIKDFFADNYLNNYDKSSKFDVSIHGQVTIDEINDAIKKLTGKEKKTTDGVKSYWYSKNKMCIGTNSTYVIMVNLDDFSTRCINA